MKDALVDLRSDTVTRPTAAMRVAMAEAEVGDDLLEGDPTTRRLEERTADLLGKERALFFPSGIMANQTALALIGNPGDEIVVEASAHVLNYEGAAAAALSGIQLLPVATENGRLTRHRVESALRSPSRYLPRTAGISVENTHLGSGGTVMAVEDAEEIFALAGENGLRVHLDGARLWNACAALDCDPRDFTRDADTVMVCYSKGLGAPVGSALAGSAELMGEAWGIRRRLGGAMRQSGIIAAGALHAVHHHRQRLSEDHVAAVKLAVGLDQIPGVSVVAPETNVVMIDLGPDAPNPEEVLSFLHIHRILMTKFGPRRLRAVTHMDVDLPGIQRAVEVFSEAIQKASKHPTLA